ncbi:LacI family DNA-binding transcriptional regulator [Pseudotenacibaculum haliotis]|uniref:LacI family DNA-binding transcriptional regulator n=1 Tax=Pseudotenacibaculum haliotis TaxID=1862138 RepID=A0ABW5LUR2_9FLAO
MKKSITIKELSKLLDVSISTVSKALNDSHEISPATKKRIQDTAKLYNYKPNRIAVHLKSGKANTIGVVLPSIKNFFLARALRGIESVIAKTDYNIIISITNESYEKEVKSIQTLANGFVDAIIIAVSEETQIKQDFTHLKNVQDDVHLLMFDRVVQSIDCDKVVVDEYEAIFNAVKELQSKGRKNIALASTINNLSVGKLRTKGYLAAIEGIQESILIEGSEGAVENEVLSLIEAQKIDAIIALDEEASLASFRIGKKKEVLSNGKLSLIGYAGTKISEHLTPSLTTINQHGKRVGRTAAELLLKKLNKPLKDPELLTVNSSLYVRETS